MKKSHFVLALAALVVTLVITGVTGASSIGHLIGDDNGGSAIVEALNENALAATSSGDDDGGIAQASGEPLAVYGTLTVKVYDIDDTLYIYGIDPSTSNGVFAGMIPPDLELSTNINKPTRVKGENGYYSIIYFLNEDENGTQYFHINVYDAGGVLLDDRFVFTR